LLRLKSSAKYNNRLDTRKMLVRSETFFDRSSLTSQYEL